MLWFALFLLTCLNARAQGVFTTPIAVDTPSSPQTVTVTAQVAGTVGTTNSVQVLTAGTANSDFTATGTSTCSGAVLVLVPTPSTCTVSVVFTPSAPGVRVGAVVLLDSTNQVLGTAYLSGIGSGGLAVLFPANLLAIAGVEGYWASTVDGVPANQADLDQPASVALDGAGNLYIADSLHNKIRKIAAPLAPSRIGIISTFAGTGTAGYTGDGLAATDATLSLPSGVAVDGAGNVYVADRGNDAIRKITAANGIISTVAGTGTGGYNGDSQPATTAQLDSPWGVTIDPGGNIFIADTSNQRIRRVDAVTGVITTVAGDGDASGLGDGKGTFTGDTGPATAAGLSLPYAVAFDPSGNMFIPDSANNRIRVVDTTGTINTYAGSAQAGYYGDGAAANLAQLNRPLGVAADAAGNVYISDTQNFAIRKVNALTGIIHTAATNGLGVAMDANYPTDPLAPDSLYGPMGMVLDGMGNLFVADYLNMTVMEMTGNFAVLDYTGTAVRQGSQSNPQLEQVENDGNAALDLTGLRPGQNAVFDENGSPDADTTTCTTGSPYLAEDLDCNIGAIFAPTVAGNPLRGDLYIDNVSIATPLDIALIGDATPVNSTTVVLTSSLNPSKYSDAVTLTATVTTGAGTGNLTGTVTFIDGTTNLITVAVNASGVATYTTSSLTVGSHSLTAAYNGDPGHFPSTSTPALIQVVDEATSTLLTSNPNPSATGSSVTFTATVTTPNGGGVTPDGNVTFFDGTTLLGSSALNASAVATFSTSALATGPHSITAVYGGDSAKYILGSTSTVLSQSVQAASTLTIISSLNPSNYGLAVTFVATIATAGPNPPTGTVKFLDGGQQIGTGTLSGASASATFTTSTLAVGVHTITATYGGDSSNSPSTSAPLTQTVNQDQTATTLVAVPNPGIAGAPVALTATVKVTLGANTPTGTVTFMDGTTNLGSATLTAGDTATIQPTLPLGAHSLVATYQGDTDDQGSVSVPLALTVQQATTTTTLTVAPNPATVLSAVTFTAKVAGNGGVPTGAVSFFSDGTPIGTANLIAGGTATLTYSNLPVGSHAITATYTGDVNDAASTSAPVTEVIGTIPTVTDLGSSVTTGTTPQLILVATVVGSSGPTPTGTVTFTNGSTVIGSAPLDATGVATLTPNLAGGSYTIVASYGGDALHGPSTSQPLTVSNPGSGFNITVTPSTMTLATSQNATVNVNLSSVAGFTDTIGLGCASLPAGVTCHFAQLTASLASDSTATVQLTIDTNSPLSGGSSAMNSTPNSAPSGRKTFLAGIFLPFGLLFGFVFWRFRKRQAKVWMVLLVLLVSVGALVATGCSGYSQSSAAPGTYTFEVVGVGMNSNITHYQNVTLTVTK